MMASKSQTEETYKKLKTDLLGGNLAPGEKLKIDMISERYKASPSAIREALSRLTSDGLVISIPQRGFSVSPISASDLIDLTSVRIEIETRCLRRAIEIGDLAWEGRIQNAWHQLKHTPLLPSTNPKTVNPDWAAIHSAFHDTLIEAGDSIWWRKLRDHMFVQAERYRRLLLPYSIDKRNMNAEHAAIVDATLKRNAVLACKLLADHLQATADSLLSSDAPLDD